MKTSDSRGKLLQRGGDRITVRCSKCPGDARTGLTTGISENNDGSYRVTLSPQVDGKYVFEVFINGTKMANTLGITCGKMTFDPDHCQPGITLSNAHQTASLTNTDCGWQAVAGTPAMQTGKHQWTIVFEGGIQGEADGFMAGVITPAAMARGGSYDNAYCFYNNTGQRYSLGTARGKIDSWCPGTTLRFDLDCDSRTLQITNTTSANSAFIVDLPGGDLLPFFSMYYPGQKTTFILQ